MSYSNGNGSVSALRNSNDTYKSPRTILSLRHRGRTRHPMLAPASHGRVTWRLFLSSAVYGNPLNSNEKRNSVDVDSVKCFDMRLDDERSISFDLEIFRHNQAPMSWRTWANKRREKDHRNSLPNTSEKMWYNGNARLIEGRTHPTIKNLLALKAAYQSWRPTGKAAFCLRTTFGEDTVKTVFQASSAGVISPRELYTLEEIKRRTGWGDTALRQARKRGLVVWYCGSRAFLWGRDFIDFIKADGKTKR